MKKNEKKATKKIEEDQFTKIVKGLAIFGAIYGLAGGFSK